MCDATEHGACFTKIGLDKFLNPQDENEVLEEVNLKGLGLEVTCIIHTEP